MEDQQEIGGAQALLQLGSKLKDGEEEDSPDHYDGNPRSDDVVEDEDSKTTNQQINDAVEAAVMRYVGGTLEGNSTAANKKKRKLAHDDIINNINDFNQWTGFLDENMTGDGDDFNDYTTDQSLRKKKKKRKRRMTNEIDPDLAGLGSSEHDQLVEAAIIDARELARHINNGGELNDDTSSVEHSLSIVPPHQAQQVIAAATASIQNLGHGSESISAITQLAQAANSISNNSRRKTTAKSRKALKRIEENLINYATGNHDQIRPEVSEKPLQVKDFDHITNVESLIEESSSRACSWYNMASTGKGARMFSEEEIAAVDHFISGYCHLSKWTREDVCNRIWSNERKKDNFWESLTRVLPYRSRASVYKHVRRQYHIFDVRAKWTKADDEILRRWAQTHEGKWKEIGEIMGRMPEDCRDRWRNYVKCGENRSSNKWSEDEERTLKQIVTEMLEVTGGKEKGGSINWTIVSERMNGTRSRIQCRYKWTKLVKRESALKSSYMTGDTKIWLIQKLQGSEYDHIEQIDWNWIGQLYEAEYPKTQGYQEWTGSDFQFVFDKLKSEVKEYRKLSLQSLYEQILDDIYKIQRFGRNAAIADEDSLLERLLEVKRNSAKEAKNGMDPNDPTNIANAAVAAVSSGVDGDLVQHQEYTLWR